MNNETPEKTPYNIPVEFVLFVGILLVALFIINIVLFGSPLAEPFKSITANSPQYVTLLSILAVCFFLVIIMRGRMLSELQAKHDKLMLAKMYEERFRLTIDNAPIGMAILTLDGRFLHVNQALCEMLGYSFDELLILSFVHIIHPIDSNADYALFQRLLRGDISRYQAGKPCLHRDGSLVETMLSMSVVRDSQGAPIHLIAQFEDITERVRVKEALAEEKERLATTLRSIVDGVIATDEQGRIVLINPVAETLTGWTQGEAIGKPLGEVFHIINEETREGCKNPVERILETGEIVGLANHTILVAREGTERSIANSCAPILDGDDNIIGVVLVFHDVIK